MTLQDQALLARDMENSSRVGADPFSIALAMSHLAKASRYLGEAHSSKAASALTKQAMAEIATAQTILGRIG